MTIRIVGKEFVTFLNNLLKKLTLLFSLMLLYSQFVTLNGHSF